MSSSNAHRFVSIVAIATFIVGCSSTPRTPAPIVDRTGGKSPVTVSSSTPAGVASYTVKRGDTLYSIALDHGRDWKDLAAWNNLGTGANISVGQALRLGPPDSGSSVAVQDSPAVQTHAITGSGRLDSRPLDAVTPLPPLSAQTPAAATTVPPVMPPIAPTPVAPPAVVPPAAPTPAATDGVTWAWPGSGAVVDKFDNNRNKGRDLAGKVGDPVLAAASGSVVYSGTGLRGYGNLIIVKHSGIFLSAYAHNSKLLVKEGDTVKLGQKIAEVGSSDTDRPKLHFEIRKDGTPVDPSTYLPSR